MQPYRKELKEKQSRDLANYKVSVVSEYFMQEGGTDSATLKEQVRFEKQQNEETMSSMSRLTTKVLYLGVACMHYLEKNKTCCINQQGQALKQEKEPRIGQISHFSLRKEKLQPLGKWAERSL